MPALRHQLGLFAVLASAGLAQAQSFTNPSFEPTAPGQFVNGGNDRMQFASAPGWTISNGSPDWMFGPGTTLWDTNWGEYFQILGAFDASTGVGGAIPPNVALAFRESVGQTVTGFTPGNFYTVGFEQVSGFYELPLGSPSPGGIELFIDGTSVMTNSVPTPGGFVALPYTSTGWQSVTHTFQATSASHTFDSMSYGSGIGAPASAQWIDNVSVQLVPEPAAAGVLGLALLGWRRRQR